MRITVHVGDEPFETSVSCLSARIYVRVVFIRHIAILIGAERVKYEVESQKYPS